MIAPAAAHSVIVLPGSNQAASVNASADDFYFDVGETANLFLYIIHPEGANFAEIGEAFNITQKVLSPDGTLQNVTVTRSSSNVSYDIGDGNSVTANWYSSNIKLDQEGVYYVLSSQKGYDENGEQTRERNSVTVLYSGDSSTGWDNLKKTGLDSGAKAILHPTADARAIQSGSSLSFFLTGDIRWFENEVTDPADILDPLPVIAGVYTTPSQMAADGAGLSIESQVISNANPTVSFKLTQSGVWTFMAVNEKGEIGDDNYQSVYVMPVKTAGTGSDADDDEDSSIPGLGIIGLIACVGIAGALFMRRK